MSNSPCMARCRAACCHVVVNALCFLTGEPLECDYEHAKASQIEASLIEDVAALVERYRHYEQYVGRELGHLGLPILTCNTV